MRRGLIASRAGGASTRRTKRKTLRGVVKDARDRGLDPIRNLTNGIIDGLNASNEAMIVHIEALIQKQREVMETLSKLRSCFRTEREVRIERKQWEYGDRKYADLYQTRIEREVTRDIERRKRGA